MAQEIFLDKGHNDRLCVDIYGLPNVVLMENAGGALARFVFKILKKILKKRGLKRGFLRGEAFKKSFDVAKNVDSKISKRSGLEFLESSSLKIKILGGKPIKIAFLCGSGDNGADGLVGARVLDCMLNIKQIDVTKIYIYPIVLKRPSSELCKMHFKILENLGFKIFSFFDFFSSDSKGSEFIESIKSCETSKAKISKEMKAKKYKIFKLKSILDSSDIIIDSLFGTGFNGAKSGLKACENYQILRQILVSSSAVKIACDVPSGVPNMLGFRDFKMQDFETCDFKDSKAQDSKIKDSKKDFNKDSKKYYDENKNINSDLDDILCPVDYTLSMGAINLALLDSRIKDIVGKIKIANLGLSQNLYSDVYNKIKLTNTKQDEDMLQNDTSIFYSPRFYILKKRDLQLPLRLQKNTHKGSFGNAYIFAGQTLGASILSAKAALSFGAGKSIIYTGLLNNRVLESAWQEEIIYSDKLPQDSWQDARSLQTSRNIESRNAFAIGMGLDYDTEQYDRLFLFIESNLYCYYIFDADIFYQKRFATILRELKNAVITPHPKEFLSLLKLTGLVDSKSNMDFLLANIPALLLKFSRTFPHIVCLLKGANTFISHQNTLFTHMLGSQNLAKGGSGDVLSGLIVALLAQGFSPLESCYNATLAHALASKDLARKIQSYALTPLKLIKSLEKLNQQKI